ncbi:MAG: leucine-rich repeat domain-containing protein, partial [Bacteroidales bacterium]|nr:leucine-rich repeat domain-containing protein [Bacteroidales bacterium]
IGNSVTSIGSSAFFGCSSLTAINVDANNPGYTSVDGVLFNKSQSELIQYPAGKTGNDYTIPHSVESIGDDAFYGCSGLTSITIPDLVTSIGNYAFRGCRKLTSITIPDLVESIGIYAFFDCSNLALVTVGNSVEHIEDYAFFNCPALASITNLNPTPQAIDSYVFVDVAIGNITLYVPTESVEAYEAASVWRDFGKITAYTPSVINTPAVTAAIRISPNPVAESFRIEGITAPSTVNVSDINGRIIFKKIISGDESITLNHWTKGIYLVHVNGMTTKIIKN